MNQIQPFIVHLAGDRPLFRRPLVTEAEGRQCAASPAADKPHAPALVRETNGQHMAHSEWVCNSSSASEKREISEVVQHKGMQMTKGQQQMLNRAVEQTAFTGFVFFVCLPQMVSHSSHIVFNSNHSCFHVQGERERGICTDFRSRSLPLA